ncbi:tRNA epoxyqueuosine(34) reductase QueG [Paraliomyxa miuraensis]|uniref:tRNA epoxyqueuosine(34) reductase QueG n=1 Tax=Paraliomyxa miuraensis TaxID=376150 RepID=UPI00224FACCB|nr:tRNA epoxyqueuosine(34) reductase QueG [Paraliomyxa miuraensis]MCX4246204.1 tRNA epoxyqueuosine(34) reductase QueG [Paraliomyxa miuraensis]
MTLTPALLRALAERASEVGLPRLGAVRLDHPGFAPARTALDRYLDEGFHGEMEFMTRTRTVRKDPSSMLPGARTAIVVAVPYRGEQSPIARYAQSADYHTVMHDRLEELETWLHARLPEARTLICVDTKPLLERTAAALSGLGFLGKHGCLIMPGLGSYVLLGALLCTAPLEAEAPDAVEASELHRVSWDACGQCTRCLDACPTQAFVAPGRLDPRRCISYLTIEHRGEIDPALADAMGERIAGCDVCQEVCPYNGGRERDARVPEVAWIGPPPGRPRTPDLVELANSGNARHRSFVKHTALRRIPRRALRRNALLALGNRAGPASKAEREAIEQAASDEDPLVRKAAKRARRRRTEG